jgi:hypothetical protein
MKEKTIVRGQTAVRSESTATAALREQLETRARDYLRRCHDTAPSVERHTIWSRLYAASERLSIAVREGDVADAVIEIGSNLLGCEEIVIVQLHAETKLMSFLASVGVSATQRYALASKFNQIAAEIRRGQARIVDKRVAGDEFLASIGVSALVPLSQGQKAGGAIVFFNLLPQRKSFDSGDRELLGLLSVYVGPSLFGI